MVKKSGIADRVKQFVSLAELETGNSVLKLQTDNGTEFVDLSLRSFLESKRMIHFRSTPHVSEQNSLIERQVRIVSDSARTMLVESQLTESLWAEALNTSVYVNNRILGRGAQKTPYEVWGSGGDQICRAYIRSVRSALRRYKLRKENGAREE